MVLGLPLVGLRFVVLVNIVGVLLGRVVSSTDVVAGASHELAHKGLIW